MQRFKQILGIIFLSVFVIFMANKFISENAGAIGGDVRIFLIVIVLILVVIGVFRILRY